MDRIETRSILSDHLNHYRLRSYTDLAGWVSEGRIDTAEIVAPSGARYQIEIQFFWDNRPNRNVRVMGAIDDGGERAFFPLTDSFILSPEGQFVGE